MDPIVEEPQRTEGDINLSEHRARWYERHLNHATRDWLDRDARVFLHQSLSTPCLNVLDSVAGSSLLDLGGRTYLDFHGNSVHQLGYGHPAVLEAVHRELAELPFCPRRYTNRSAIKCAERLVGLAPEGLDRVLFAPGGAGAMGMALKLARLVTGRWKTVSFYDAFHGASLDAISVGGERLFRDRMGPLLPGALHVPPPGHAGRRSREGLDPLACLEYLFEKEGDLAAVVAEPIRCTTVEVPDAHYWRSVRALCDQHGALLIFDEVPICLGRTGKWFSLEHFGVIPDVLVVGKGLGGGVIPMAAMITREAFNEAGASMALGHYTHEKSPVGCAAALATIETLDREGLIDRANYLGERLVGQLKALGERYPEIQEVRSAGLLVGVELRCEGEEKATVAYAEGVLYACLERGLSFKISSGCVLTLTPPLVVREDELDRAVAILDESLRVARGRVGVHATSGNR